MKFGSLFTGIGGIDLGLERAGMECAWQVEIDPYCQKVLQKHWPLVNHYGDIKDVGKFNLNPVDLICGGFPCQPHSLAGSRKASEDTRDLWPQFARIIRDLEPKWVLAENVPGLLSSENGRFFGRVLRDLATSGYDAEWQSLPAAAFGASHIRERVFIVAYRSCSGSRELSASTARGGAQGTHLDGLRKTLPNDHSNGFEMQCQPFANAETGTRIFTSFEYSNGWEAEPNVVRVVHGFPGRVDRIRGLGNAVVPAVVEWIGKRILEVENG